MGKNKNAVVTKGFTGLIGDDIVFRQTQGDTVVAKPPKKTDKPPHPVRLEAQKLFKKASLYAKAVEADPVQKAVYAQAIKGTQSAFNLALRDARKAPTVNEIDASKYKGQMGNRIKIDATDDFKVISVLVAIYGSDETLIEEGNATIPALEVDWFYTATVVNPSLPGTKITATATDIPGNEGSREITL